MKAFACGIALAGLVLVSRSAGADPTLDRLHACMAEQNDAARLACYDKELGRSTAKGQPPDFGMTTQLLHKQQAQAGIKPPPPPAPETLSAKVMNIVARGNGTLVLTLDNGQVWEQQEASDTLLQVGDGVTIKHGTFGALWMDDVSRHRRTRVKRVQ
jgi:hypothetical protein